MLKIDLIAKWPSRSFFTVEKWPPVTFQLLRHDRGSFFNSLESLFNVEKWPFFACVIISWPPYMLKIDPFVEIWPEHPM